MFDDANLPEERDNGQISEHTSDFQNTSKVDAKCQKFIFKDGTALSTTELTGRITGAEPSMQVDIIDAYVIHWLEESYWSKACQRRKW